MGSRPLTVYSCYVISLVNVLTSPQIMVICTIVQLTVHLLSDCIIHISPPSCISMHWGYILCSAARLREIRLVGHDDITHCRHHETHF